MVWFDLNSDSESEDAEPSAEPSETEYGSAVAQEFVNEFQIVLEMPPNQPLQQELVVEQSPTFGFAPHPPLQQAPVVHTPPDAPHLPVQQAPAAAQRPLVVSEAKGVKLHLSSRNATGYLRVYQHTVRTTGGVGTFFAQLRDTRCFSGFSTAVEAALAYARHVGEAPTFTEPIKRKRNGVVDGFYEEQSDDFYEEEWHGVYEERSSDELLPAASNWAQCGACAKWRRTVP
eukprot:4136332-Prymnesium_polylepis.1